VSINTLTGSLQKIHPKYLADNS